MNAEKEYIIVADYYNHKGEKTHDVCLIYVCGEDKDLAERVIKRLETNPNETDLHHIRDGARNFRVEEIESESAWWKDPYLCN